MSDADRLDAYRGLLARPPTDDYRRGSKVTHAGAPDRRERWRALPATFLAYVRIDRDESQEAKWHHDAA